MASQISVVMPFYNCAHTLVESIQSILNQTFTDFELILIDNNSTDSSYDIAAGFEAADKRIKLINEPQQGIVHALNTGIDEAKGKYIARMDGDDISLPERLEKQFNYLETNPKTGLVACCVNYIGDENVYKGFYEYVKWNNRIISHEEIANNRFIEAPLVHPTVMFHRELVNKYGAYKQGFFPEDFELWLRWLHSGVIMHKLPEYLLDWKDSENRLTRTDERYSTLAFFETKTFYLYDWLKENNKFFPKVAVWGAGRLSRQRFSLLHELGIDPKFFIDLRENPTYNVINFKQTPPAGKHFIVSYVANREAREKIKIFLVELGYMEGRDFILVA